MELEFCGQSLKKEKPNFMKIRPVGAELLFHVDESTGRQAGRQRDRQTDTTKLTVASVLLHKTSNNSILLVELY